MNPSARRTRRLDLRRFARLALLVAGLDRDEVDDVIADVRDLQRGAGIID